MLPPQALGKGPSPQELELQQQVQQLSGLLAKALDRNAQDRIKLVGKSEMRDIDVYKAETDRMKALQDALPTDAEGLRQLVQQLMQEAAESSLTPVMQANSEDLTEGDPSGQMDEPPAPPHPALGAKQAPDGQWYVRDPTRRSQYLRMAPLVQKHNGGPHG